jgi:imidazolonepropionase-like amidohydrolase
MDKARKAGFTQFASSLEGKLMPGAVEVFHLVGTDPKTAIAREAFAQKIQFEASDVYPSTLMAMMAKIRQLWNDAAALQEHQQLYASAPATTPLPAKEPVLEALFPVLQKKQTVFFHADSKEDIERVLKLKKELGFELVLVSAREGWMLKEELAKQKVSVIATLNVADKPKFMADTTKKVASKQPSDEEKAFNARQESAWKAELNNIKDLQKAGVKVGATTNGVKPDDFRKKFDLFLANGYEEKELVSLLTRQTAEILGLGAVSGDLKKGMQAHFTLMNKPFKDSKAAVQHHVAAGNHKNLLQTDASAPVMRRPRTSEVE